MNQRRCVQFIDGLCQCALSACTSAAANNCTLTYNGIAYTADLSTAVWSQGVTATSGYVEVKGYMTSANTFKVTMAELKQ